MLAPDTPPPLETSRDIGLYYCQRTRLAPVTRDYSLCQRARRRVRFSNKNYNAALRFGRRMTLITISRFEGNLEQEGRRSFVAPSFVRRRGIKKK